MEPPPAAPVSVANLPPIPTTAAVTIAAAAATYPDSIDSSPRSRATDFDDTFAAAADGGGGRLRLMCSYGGHIVPRPHDKSLCYVGGDTRIVVVDRSSTLPDLHSRLSKTLLNGRPFTLKYQLPNEDLDSLITVSTEEDLDNMVDEYDRLVGSSNPAKPGRIRLFLFPSKPDGATSIGSILDGTNLCDDWFFNALNGAAVLQRGFSDPASVNCLLGLDVGGSGGGGNGNNSSAKEDSMECIGHGGDGGKLGKVGNQNQSSPDIHSVPDSPIIETTSSFGSTSSSPSLANLPPIRVHVEDGGGRVSEQRVGIEEQFAQMGIGVHKQADEGFCVLSSPPAPLPPAPAVGTGVPVPAAGMIVGGVSEFPSRVSSDDERSDHGVPAGSRIQQLPQQTLGQPVLNSQTQQKQMAVGELTSPDSVSSDSSLSNAISRQKPVMYQDPVTQMPTGSNRLPPNMIDLNAHVQVFDSGYTFTPQYDHQQQVFHQQHLHQQQQPPPHHHPPAGAVPLSTYYQMYPPQQPHQHTHQYQVYYVPAGQAQAYRFPETATAIPSSHPQTPPNPTIITTSAAYNQNKNVPNPKPEMSGVHRVAPAGPQLVQVPSSHLHSQSQSQSQPQPQVQQQFMGYSQIHHPSQSIAPNSAANAAYAYEFADPGHAQIFYTQPLAPPLAAQYQAVTSGATMVLPDGSSLNANDNLKQQFRSSQPL